MTHVSEITSYLSYLASSLGAYFSPKFFGSVAVAIYGFFFGFELGNIMLALFALTCFDLITGIMAAWKRGETIKSRTALRSAIKLTVYGLMVSSAHLAEAAVPGTTFMDEGMIAFLALTEMISILENAGSLGFAIPQKLLNQLHDWRENEGDRRVGPETRRDEIVIHPADDIRV